MGLYGTLSGFSPDQVSGSSYVPVRATSAPTAQPENTGAAGWVPTPPPQVSPNSFVSNGGQAIPQGWSPSSVPNSTTASPTASKHSDDYVSGYRGIVPNGGMQLGGARAPAAPQAQAPQMPQVDLKDPRNAALAGYR